MRTPPKLILWMKWPSPDLGLIVYLPLSLLAAFSFAGYRLASFFGASGLLADLTSVVEPVLGLPAPVLFAVIFLNNALKGLLAVLLGVGLGLYPLLLLMGNGLILGAVVAEATAQRGAAFAVLGLAPHGLLEIPAILVCAGLGLRLGAEVSLGFLGRPTRVRILLRRALTTYFRLLLPLFFAAAVVEVLLTPLLLAAFL